MEGCGGATAEGSGCGQHVLSAKKKDKKQFRCGARISGNRPSPAGPGLRRKTEETEREDNHSQESAAHDGPFEKASTQGPASPRHAS